MSTTSSISRPGGKYCCVPGCKSRDIKVSNQEAVSLYKVPNGRKCYFGANSTNWASNFQKILFRYRDPKNGNFQEKINSGKAYICCNHFKKNEICRGVHKTWLKMEALPTEDMPKKSFEAPVVKSRRSIVKVEVSSKPRPFLVSKGFFTCESIVALANICSAILDKETLLVHQSKTMMSVLLLDDVRIVPKVRLNIAENLSFNVSIYGIPLPKCHFLYTSDFLTMKDFITSVSSINMCSGLLSPPRKEGWIPVTFYEQRDLKSTTLYIAEKCNVGIVEKGKSVCNKCAELSRHQELLDARKSERIEDLSNVALSAKCAPKICSKERLEQTTLLNRKRIFDLEKEINDNGVSVSKSVAEIVDKVLSKQDNEDSAFLHLWWNSQKKLQDTSPNQRRYPPSVIKFCLRLYGKSPAAYMLLNEVLILPSPRTLCREKNAAGVASPGIQVDLLNKISSLLTGKSYAECAAALLFDELTIKEDIIYRSCDETALGYVDFGRDDLNSLSNSSRVATHVLAVFLRGITNHVMDRRIAYFPTSNLSYSQLLLVLVECIMQLEMNTPAKVIALIGDGLASNTTVFKTLSEDESDGIGFKMKNPMDTSRYIYMIQDPPHLIKTVRNNLLSTKRNLWNLGDIHWKPIEDIIRNDLKLGDLRYFPKLNESNARPSSWEKMKVNIAARTLSRSVGLELGRIGEKVMSEFVLLIDQWFDMMNTGLYDYKKKAKPCLAPFKTNFFETEKRLSWLENEFVGYFKSWRQNVENREMKCIGKVDRKKMLLSESTEKGLIMTTKSVVCLVRHLLDNGAEYILTRRINQDPLESYFGQQRQRGRFNDSPNVALFGYNMRCIEGLRKHTVKNSNVEDCSN